MIRNIVRAIITLLGAIIGYFVSQGVMAIPYLDEWGFTRGLPFTVAVIAVFVFIFGLIFFLLSSKIYKLLNTTNTLIEKKLLQYY